MKTKYTLIAALAISLLVGCSTTRVQQNASTQTNVNIREGNFTTLKAGAVGKSYGFRFFLGIIPITAPSVAEARKDLYDNVGVDLTGRSVALINTSEDRSTLWLLLFSVPKVAVAGDVVEFNRPPALMPPIGYSPISE